MDVLFAHQKLTSMGGNGSFPTAGLRVATHAENPDQQLHFLQLTGITGPGNLASGDLAVPITDVPKLIAALHQQLHDYHQQQGLPRGHQPEIEMLNQAYARVIVNLPDGREVIVHRDEENSSTSVDIWAPPTRGGLDEWFAFSDDKPLNENQILPTPAA